MDETEPDDREERLRDAVERSRSGAPAVGRVVRDRFSTDEVFQRIVAAADEEITAGSRELFFSGLAAGFAITITFLLYVSLTASTGGDPVLSALLYPLGFIYIIIGGYQLYTENTLPPVALTLERVASVPALLRNWVVVLAGNFAGGTFGAIALAWGGVLSPEAGAAAASIATKGIETGSSVLFTKAAFAGLIVAGVVWVEYAARDTISRLVVVYLAFLSIPIGGLFHVVVSYTEMVYLVLLGDLSLLVGMVEFVLPVLVGNTLGGVVLVTVVNYFQTTEQRLESARFEGADRRLSRQEWLFGGYAGRSYVPLIDTAEPAAATGEDQFRIVVPITNPRTETRLKEFACKLASERDNAIVHVVHIVQMPRQSSRSYGVEQSRRIIEESEALMSDIHDVADGYGVDCDTSTVLSHRSFEELFTVAERKDADLVVMKWGDEGVWRAARADRPLDELTRQLPCDFLVLKDRGLDTSRVLLPTAGDAASDINADVARTLRAVDGSEVSLLHVVDGPEQRDHGERFLAGWAAEHDLEDAVRIVDDTGDIEGAIAREAEDHTLVLLGASERGLLSRLARDALYLDVVDDLDCSFALAEPATDRGLLERLFG
ncbi:MULTISPECIES: formate/nitrite transporter family protein [Salinibaculum]|uniref:formate/nitrite transporter family protein n=1 Tax=Salinibaculum TaxID=2732368 RepID=UPI0030D079B0